MAESIAGVTEAELKERKEHIDVGIAFLVLFFMVGLGAYLMTTGDSESTLFQSDADVGATGVTAGSVLERAATVSETFGIDNPDRRDRQAGREAAVAGPVAVSAAVEAPQLANPEIESSLIESSPIQPAAVVSEIVQTSAPVLQEPVLQEPVVQEAVIQEPEVAEIPEIPAVKDAPLTAEESAVLSLATENVTFVTGSAVLTEESKVILDKILVLLGQRDDAHLSVVGHTDSLGDADKNVALSFARAEACRDYLLAGGAKVGQVDSAGMGERQPIADNSTAAGRKANRRVEFRLLQSVR